MRINEKSYAYGASKSSIRDRGVRAGPQGRDRHQEHLLTSRWATTLFYAGGAASRCARSIALPPSQIHGYTPAAGLPAARAAVAGTSTVLPGTSYEPGDLYLTCGAAASLSITLNALVNDGDEVIVIAPYFPEYRVWWRPRVPPASVMADPATFQIDARAV